VNESRAGAGGFLAYIVNTSLRLRVIVVTLAIALLAIGPRLINDIPLDVFPEFAPPLIEIQTEVGGLSTNDVERLVTIPLENALIGTPWVSTVRSKSVLGLSSVVLYFDRGTDLSAARQLVQERVARAAALLPDLARPPVILSPLSATSRVLKIGLSSPSLSQIELTTLAMWTIRPRLMAVPGVANVAIWGQRDRQLQILVDPDRLQAHGVTLSDVVRAGENATRVGAGGFIDTPNQRMAVTQSQAISGVADLAQTVVAYRHGSPLTLGDITDVVEGHPPPIGDAIINDGPGLLLVVEKQPWGNTLEVTRGVEEALVALEPGLGNVVVDPTIFRPATFIEMSLRNLSLALLFGSVLVVILLSAFLYDWRTALISLVAIPLSLLAAMLVLRYRGGTIDTMVLAGLVIALGEVVDDAIIDVENITRRLRLNRRAPNPEPAYQVVLQASLEVRSAVVYGSVIVVMLFIPVFFLGGLAGSFFRPLAMAYILAIVASLAVALTLTPAMALILLPNAPSRPHGSPLVTWLKDRYRRMLPGLVNRPRRLIQWVAGAFALAGLVALTLGEAFLPDFKEYDFLMHWVEKPGTSIEAMDRITVQVSQELRAIPGVRNFGAHIGRAEVADEVVGPNFTELWISLDPNADYQASVSSIHEVVNGYPGLYRDVLTYLRERIKEVLTGASATVVVRITGSDLASLRASANNVYRAIEDIDGIIDLKVQPQVLVPQIEIRVQPEAAQRLGLTPGDVQRTVATLIKGTKVGEYYEHQAVFDVVVWGEPGLRRDPLALGRLLIDSPGGAVVPLDAVADIAIVPMPNQITRENGSRYIDVTCNVSGRDLGSVAHEIEAAVLGLSYPLGFHPEVIGEFAATRAARNQLLELSLLAILGIFLVLHADFGSLRPTLIVFVTLPFAMIGGIVGVALTGGVLSLGSMVGFVTVLGIAARNGIMLVSHFRHLELNEGMPFGPALVMRGAEERLTPILMTALATGFALLPIALRGNLPGHEIEHPLAIVIIGGLLTSTVLNLVVVPGLYLKYGRSFRSKAGTPEHYSTT